MCNVKCFQVILLVVSACLKSESAAFSQIGVGDLLHGVGEADARVVEPRASRYPSNAAYFSRVPPTSVHTVSSGTVF
jgi:hypothetical protein